MLTVETLPGDRRATFVLADYGQKDLARECHFQFRPGLKVWAAPLTHAFAQLISHRITPADMAPFARAEVARLLAEHADNVSALEQLRQARTDAALLAELSAGIAWPDRLMSHQRHMVLHGLIFSHFGYFAEMGTGKTLAALATFKVLRDLGLVRKLLVCCPPRLQDEAWRRQAAEHLGWTAEILSGSLALRAAQFSRTKADMVITSHTAIRLQGVTYAKRLAEGGWMVIFDESSRLGGKKSQQAEAACRIAAAADRVLILTGTPFAGKLDRLFRQLLLLDQGACYGPSWSRFLELAVKLGAKTDWFGKIAWETSAPFVALVHAGIEANSVAWARSECVDLPERVYRTLLVDMGPKQRAVYLQVKAGDFLHADAGSAPAPQAALKVLALAQVTSGFYRAAPAEGEARGEVIRLGENPKLDLLCDLFLDELDGLKVIVWVRFHAELDLVAEGLRATGVTVAEFSGRQNDEGKAKALAEFRAPVGCQVLLATAETGGYGLSLNEAAAMVFFSVGYDWEVYLQACDRNQRIGQTRKCVVIRLLCRDSVDERIAANLAHKGKLRDIILD